MSVEKTPTSDQISKPKILGGFGQVLDHPEPESSDAVSADLDLHLNPKNKSFDVLEKQKNEAPEESALLQFDSENEDIKPIDSEQIDSQGSHFIGEIDLPQKESYKTPEALISYVKKLNEEKDGELSVLLWDLDSSPSQNSVFRYLENNREKLGNDVYNKALSLAGYESPFKSELDEDDNSAEDKEEESESTSESSDEVKKVETKEPKEDFTTFEIGIDDLKKRFMVGSGNFIKLIKIETLNENSNVPFIGDVLEGKLENDVKIGSKVSFEDGGFTSSLQKIIEKDEKIYFQTVNSVYELVADKKDESKKISEEIPTAVEIAVEKPVEEEDLPINAIPENLETGIPMMITNKLRADLKAVGISDSEIDKMKPKEAWDLLKDKLNSKPQEVKEEVKTLDVESAENAPLDSARLDYVKELKQWKETIRNKKNIFHRVLAELGVEKQLPETEKPQTLIDAENAYIQARKDYYKKTGLFEKVKNEKRETKGQVLGLRETTYEINLDLAEAALKEKELLQQMLVDGLPQGEKSVVDKSVSKWKSYVPSKRAWVSFGLLTGTTFVFSGVGLAGAAAYGGYRASRMIAGNVVGVGVGKIVDGIHKKKNKKESEEIYDEYGTYIDPTNFEDKEKELANLLNKQDKKIKRQNIKKLVAMMTAGGATSASFGLAEMLSGKDLPSGSIGSRAIPTETESLVSESVPEIKVELSPEGFIQDIQNLKAEIIEKYGGADNVPENIKSNILDKNSVGLAKELGLYDPENDTSGLGFKGETLSLDQEGNIVLGHLDGQKEVLFNSADSKVNPFQGEMINRDLMTDEDIEKMYPEEKSIPDLNDKITDKLPEMEKVDLEAPAQEKPTDVVNPDTSKLVTNEAPLQYGFVDIVERDGLKAMMYKNGADLIEVAHEKNGIMVLDDKFQNGNGLLNRQIRETFAKSFGEMYPDLTVFPPVPFEGGRIDIDNFLDEKGNPNNMKLLLNGREFARGPVGNVELLNERGIKSGWFLADTPYERAFKHVQSVFKTLKK